MTTSFTTKSGKKKRRHQFNFLMNRRLKSDSTRRRNKNSGKQMSAIVHFTDPRYSTDNKKKRDAKSKTMCVPENCWRVKQLPEEKWFPISTAFDLSVKYATIKCAKMLNNLIKKMTVID